MISRLTISQRLIAAFSLLTLLTAMLGWIAYQGNDTLASATTQGQRMKVCRPIYRTRRLDRLLSVSCFAK